MTNHYTAAQQLRQILSGEDQFHKGHQIIQLRRPKKETPPWAYNSRSIQAFVLRCFPKINTNDKHRMRAGRWVRIIYLYFHLGYSRGQVAAELDISYNSVSSLIRSIKRAARGLRADTATPAGKPHGPTPTE